MAYFERTFTIRAVVERVFAIQADPPGWPRWNPVIHRVDALDEGPFRVGARYRIHGERASVWVVTRHEPPRIYEWETRVVPGLALQAGHVVEPAADGARVTLWLRSRGLLAVLFGPLLKRSLETAVAEEAAGLVRFCEA